MSGINMNESEMGQEVPNAVPPNAFALADAMDSKKRKSVTYSDSESAHNTYRDNLVQKALSDPLKPPPRKNKKRRPVQ